jgi:hypothetical protein
MTQILHGLYFTPLLNELELKKVTPEFYPYRSRGRIWSLLFGSQVQCEMGWMQALSLLQLGYSSLGAGYLLEHWEHVFFLCSQECRTSRSVIYKFNFFMNSTFCGSSREEHKTTKLKPLYKALLLLLKTKKYKQIWYLKLGFESMTLHRWLISLPQLCSHKFLHLKSSYDWLKIYIVAV